MTEVFQAHLTWTGASQGGTLSPSGPSRDFEVTLGINTLPLSSAPGFSGDPSRLNPEQLYVAAIAGCQALTYLAIAARERLSVVGYSDEAEGTLERVDGRMRMSRVVLRPKITLEGVADDAAAAGGVVQARALVERAHRACFIANSVTARIEIEPSFEFVEAARLV